MDIRTDRTNFKAFDPTASLLSTRHVTVWLWCLKIVTKIRNYYLYGLLNTNSVEVVPDNARKLRGIPRDALEVLPITVVCRRQRTWEMLNRFSGNLILSSLTKIYPTSIFIYFCHVQQLFYTNYMRFCAPFFMGIGKIFIWAKKFVRKNFNVRVLINVLNIRTFARLPNSFIPYFWL